MNLTLPRRCFNVERIISSTEYSCQAELCCREGTGMAMIYQLSPSILIACFDFHANYYCLNKNRRNHILEINYCTHGRSEHVLSDGSLQYLGKHDLTCNLESSHTQELFFPLGYYAGIGIVIDLDNPDALKKTFPFLPENTLPNLVDRIQMYGPDFAFSMEPIIQNLHMVPQELSEHAKRIWLCLRTGELLLYLNHHSFDHEQPKAIYERQQIEQIKDIHKQMTDNLDRRYSIEDLSRQYFISPTKLKSAFKDVYGESIGTYMKNYRIQKAAEWLRESEMTVETISTKLGYQNSSKFSAAFKDVMGCSPAIYRKQYQK